MLLQNLRRAGYWIAAIAILPGLSLAAGHDRSSGNAVADNHHTVYAREAAGILKGLRSEAVDAATHASNLQSAEQNESVSWEAHVSDLEALKNDVNSIGAGLRRLEEIRGSISPVQSTELDSIEPLAQDLARQTTLAIRYVKDNRDALWSSVYKKDVLALAAAAESLSHSLNQYQQFAKVHAKDLRLEKSLGVKSGA